MEEETVTIPNEDYLGLLHTGNLPQKVTSTKLSFVPSTGALTATGGISGGTF